MASETIIVKLVWVDEADKQVGVRVSQDGRTQDISVEDLPQLRRKLDNAVVTSYGVRGKSGVTLEHRPLTRQTGAQVTTYTLMHGNDEVLIVYPDTGSVTTIDDKLRPWALSGLVLTASIFMDWLNRRVDNLSRTYMNCVYIARKVGRDREKILRDSCAISVIDNYWVKRSDVKTSWSELKRKRDKNTKLANTALTGQITDSPFDKLVDDTTSLFTLKGAFPKAALKGFILKKGSNAEYEVVASQLGDALGISVAKSTKRESIVACQIFTSEFVSMAHAYDFLHLTDYRAEIDNDEHRAVYDYFSRHNQDDVVRQLERLYIFNYLAANVDLHYENFGFLYDSRTTEVTGVAPAYDFNSAFGAWPDVKAYYAWIVNNLPSFIRRHPAILEKLQSSEFLQIVDGLTDLTQEQKDSLLARANYLTEIMGGD
ncbi:hypothetical protein FACS1894208_00690 [Clostridia bacterium]|nr:hypothetical protein FACS1894208_00690 [Clostridia bacterium]